MNEAYLLRQALLTGQPVPVQVVSGSMAPFLRPGDTVWVVAARLNELRPGEVVVVEERPGQLLTHRLVQIEADYFLTRGDRFVVFDAPWPHSALVGRVVGQNRPGLLWQKLMVWESARLQKGQTGRVVHALLLTLGRVLAWWARR